MQGHHEQLRSYPSGLILVLQFDVARDIVGETIGRFVTTFPTPISNLNDTTIT